jgi:uncharacterized protein
MDIQFVRENHKGAFYIGESNNRTAEMSFSMAGENTMIIDHTDVSDALRGTGAGKKLVLAAVEKARKENLKIIPLCPFAKTVIMRDQSLQDVL